MSLNFKAVTFTNFGYKEFTHNLISSVNQNNVDLDIEVHTLDDESYDFFKHNHNSVFKLENSNITKEFLGQKSENFGDMMMKKFQLIFTSLQESDYVLYIDGDIVIKKSIQKYLFKNTKYKDIIFQNDKRPSKPNLINLCAGFMLIKSNKKTLKFFNPENISLNKFNNLSTHDQTYINRNKSKFNYSVLPLDDFPNGPHYYNNHEILDPYLIHFNFIVGEKKKDKMIEYGEWYI